MTDPRRNCAVNDCERVSLVRAAVATILVLHLAGLVLQILGGGDVGMLATELLG